MNAALKKYIIVFVIGSMLIPFIFIKDIYPFFRFGMYAESYKTTKTAQEKFEIYTYTPDTMQLFYSPNIGINVSVFEYMKRKYHYLGKGEWLLSQLDSLSAPHQSSLQWKMYRYTPSDTALVATYK
jgi:hypothetical protein